MKKLIITLLLLTTTLIYSNDKDIFQEGEYLEYNVSFWGIDLGKIKIYTDEKQVMNGESVFKTRVVMKSNPSIPFVDLDAIFNSWIDTSVAFTHKFLGVENSEKVTSILNMDFRYNDKKLDVEYTQNNKVVETHNYNTGTKWNDGTSLFFFSRKFINSGRKMIVPTIVTGDTATTIFHFHNKRTSIEVDAIDYPVKVVYFNGQALWEGIYGMSGKFQGWFSDDKESIPILAKMSVYVGNVNIELVNWKRKGWEAPKYN